jgi:serine/threonine-protein kinase HipA
VNAGDEVEVYLDQPGRQPVRVGTLRPSFAGGRNLASTSFQYEPSYLASTAPWAISPDLPLRPSRTYTAENQTLFGAFEDASPDQWGQKIIEANHAVLLKKGSSLPRRIGDFDFLIGVSDHTRMGALRFRRPGTDAWLSGDSAVANIHDIGKVVDAARRYEAHQASDEDVAYLSEIATSPGGARPKANIVTHNKRLAIAKLPHSKDDDIDVEGWESLALTLAKKIGSRTPSFETFHASPDTTVLLVQRFDRTESGARLGYISAATALGIGKHDDSRYTYEDFADTIAEFSSSAGADLREMYARIALTVLINNVDDHWRNHGFLRGAKGWQLSPIFDVNPNPRHGVINSRPISDQDDPRHRDIANLLAIADAYKLTQEQGASIIQSVAREVEQWPAIATKLGLSAQQQSTMSRAFDEDQLRRAKELGPTASTTVVGAIEKRSPNGQVWVNEHIRNGTKVDAHWRSAPDRRPKLS